MTSSKGFIYLIQSSKDDSYYFGSTSNVEHRLRQHNEGKSRSTTINKPWRKVAVVEFDSLCDARSIEQKLKSHKKKVTQEWFNTAIQFYRC